MEITVTKVQDACDGLNLIEGTEQSDLLTATQATDCIITGAGSDIIFATFRSIRGDVVHDFSLGDTLLFNGLSVLTQDVEVVGGSAVFTITDSGRGRTSFTFEGDFADETFAVISQDNQTLIGLVGPGGTLLSAAGERFITTDDGSNLVYGDNADDVILTAGGDDILSGGRGEDVLVGGDGDDFLVGGLGSDRMNGGAGADSFIISASDFASGTTIDAIQDFTPGEDVLSLGGFDIDAFSQLSFIGVQRGLAIDLGNQRFIVLEGLNVGDLSAADVAFSEYDASFGIVSTALVHRLTDADDRFITTDNIANEVFGGDGDDVLIGAGGADRLLGENGEDVILGGDGADLLRGGQGSDSMEGGNGADVFEFVAGEETDFTAEVIRDFTAGEDIVSLIGFGLNSDMLEFVTIGSGDLALRLQPTHFVAFEDITNLSQLGDLDSGFVFG